MRLVAVSREAAAVLREATVRRAVSREAAGKIQQPGDRKFFSTGTRVLRHWGYSFYTWGIIRID
jgi:hypothetical protein